MKCYCCKEELTEDNRSDEHILLNAIGGRLKSKDLLCKECNSKFGEGFDSELAKQLEFLSTFLNVKRERGNHPIFKNVKTSDGKEIHLLPGGKPYYSKPTFDETSEDGNLKITFAARNDKEFESIARGINKKHPIIPVNTMIENAIHHKEYIKKPLKVSQAIGGQKAFNAIIKIALNYYIFKQKDFSKVEDTIKILKDGTDNNLCKHFHPSKLYKIEEDEICHVIHIESNKNNGNLIAFVEFFSGFSFIILLSDNYNEESIKHTYAYDVLKSKEVKKDISLKISNEEFNGLSVLPADNVNPITKKLDRVLKTGLRMQTYAEIAAIYERSREYIFKEKYKDKVKSEEELNDEFLEHVSLELAKFLCRDNSNFKIAH